MSIKNKHAISAQGYLHNQFFISVIVCLIIFNFLITTTAAAVYDIEFSNVHEHELKQKYDIKEHFQIVDEKIVTTYHYEEVMITLITP